MSFGAIFFYVVDSFREAIRPPHPPYNVSGVSRHHRPRTWKSKRLVYNIIVAKRIVSISMSGLVQYFSDLSTIFYAQLSAPSIIYIASKSAFYTLSVLF